MIFYESPILSMLFLLLFSVGLHLALKSDAPRK